MKAGTLSRRVELQENIAGLDEFNTPLPPNWVTRAWVWANIANKSGLETLKSDVDVSIVQTSVRIRHRAGITAAWRVKYGSKVYDVRAVLDDVANKVFTDLVCQQGANDG